MTAEELRHVNGGFNLACRIYEHLIEPETLTSLTEDELRTLYYRTEREDLRFEIERLLPKENGKNRRR